MLKIFLFIFYINIIFVFGYNNVQISPTKYIPYSRVKKIFLDINDNDKIIKQNSKRKILKIAKIGRNKTIQYSGYISFIIFFLISNFLIIKIS